MYTKTSLKKVADQTAVLRKAYDKLQQQTKMLEKRNQDIIDMLGTIVEYRNLESGEHIQRVKVIRGYLQRILQKLSGV